jgi:hypothetical protein
MLDHRLVHHPTDSQQIRLFTLRIDRVIVGSFQELVKVLPEEAVPGDSVPGERGARHRDDGSEYRRRRNGVTDLAVGEPEPEA